MNALLSTGYWERADGSLNTMRPSPFVVSPCIQAERGEGPTIGLKESLGSLRQAAASSSLLPLAGLLLCLLYASACH